MLAIRRAVAAAPKRVFVSPMGQIMHFSNFRDKEKAVEAVYFKYVYTISKIVKKDQRLTS